MAVANGDFAVSVQQEILKDVDAKVAQKVEELWQKGKQMLNQVQQKQQEKAEKLSEEVTRCVERQRALEAETEQLKQLLADMTNRMNVICGSCVQPAPGLTTATPSTTASHNSVSSTSPVPRSSENAGLFTPVRGDDKCEPLPLLAEVPPFPFPSQPTAPASAGGASAAPILLSEALGSGSAEKSSDLPQTPALLSLASSLPPTSPAEEPQPPTLLSLASSLPQAATAVEAYPGGGNPLVFSFTIRKADETDLGLNVTQREQERVLCVEGVRAEGAVDAWNRQCLGGAYPERVVYPGDMIIGVNNIHYDPERMLEECKDRQLLKLTIARGGFPEPVPPPSPSPGTSTAASATASPLPATSTSLRAEASEFVPRAVEATPKATASPACPAVV